MANQEFVGNIKRDLAFNSIDFLRSREESNRNESWFHFNSNQEEIKFAISLSIQTEMKIIKKIDKFWKQRSFTGD